MLVSKTNALPLGYTPIMLRQQGWEEIRTLVVMHTLTFKASTLDHSVTQKKLKS